MDAKYKARPQKRKINELYSVVVSVHLFSYCQILLLLFKTLESDFFPFIFNFLMANVKCPALSIFSDCKSVTEMCYFYGDEG